MFKNEIKKELQDIYNSNNKIDKSITNIKVDLHNLDKLGFNTEDLIKQLDNVNIEFYKFKVKNIEFFNSWKKGE